MKISKRFVFITAIIAALISIAGGASAAPPASLSELRGYFKGRTIAMEAELACGGEVRAMFPDSRFELINRITDGAAMLKTKKADGFAVDVSIADGVAKSHPELAAAAVLITVQRLDSSPDNDKEGKPCDGSRLVMLMRREDMGAAESLADLQKRFGRGSRIGTLLGSIYDKAASENFPQAELFYPNSPADLLEAILTDRIDGAVTDRAASMAMISSKKGLRISPVKFRGWDMSYALSLGNTKLAAQLNGFIKKLRSSGAASRLYDKWTASGDEGKKMPPIPSDGKRGVLRVATDALFPPFSYLKDGKPTGYEFEVLALFAAEYGYGLRFDSMNFGSILPAVSSGKADIGAAGITVTEERKKHVLFSEPFAEAEPAMILRDDGWKEEKRGLAAALWSEFKDGLNNNFIVESRWKMLVSGLGVTVVISLSSAFAGLVAGFGLCMARRSKRRWLSSMAAAYIRLMQGLPIVVFLMLLYYVVFARCEVSAVVVAVTGFAMNFSAYVAEQMRAALSSVSKGELEAAAALGFNSRESFLLVAAPQAARIFLPVFNGQFISLVKETSVVGYITVQDLTRMSDIIRSRTYEAFFPLLLTAVIYFVITWAFVRLLDMPAARIDPSRRPRAVKGVRMR